MLSTNRFHSRCRNLLFSLSDFRLGSFKIRGIGLLCTEKASTTSEFVCSSGGNAGMAAAFAGRKLNKPVTIFVPTTTPQATIDNLKRENANVIVHGDVWDESHARTLKEASRPGVSLVHPFDDPISNTELRI